MSRFVPILSVAASCAAHATLAAALVAGGFSAPVPDIGGGGGEAGGAAAGGGGSGFAVRLRPGAAAPVPAVTPPRPEPEPEPELELEPELEPEPTPAVTPPRPEPEPTPAVEAPAGAGPDVPVEPARAAPASVSAPASPEGGPAGAEPDAAGGGPGGGGGPLLGSAPRPRYPDRCRRLGHEGVAVLVVDVAADGTVARVSVARSAGCPDLDRAAEAALREARFEPARRLGVATASRVEVPVRFRIVD